MAIDQPLYVKFAPFALVTTVVVMAYLIGGALEGGVGDLPTGKVGAIIDEAKKTISEIKRSVEGGDERPARKEKKQPGKPKAAPLAKEPRLIFDFVSASQVGMMKLGRPSGVQASFSIDESQGGPSPVSGRLSITSMGPGDGKKGYAAGIIKFSEPVNVADFSAIELHVRGRGVNRFGIGIAIRTEAGHLRWDKSNNRPGDEWKVLTIPFTDFKLWSYDLASKKFTRVKPWTHPEMIDHVRVYVREKDLETPHSGDLWIDAIALR